MQLEGAPFVSAAFSHGFGSFAGAFVSIAIVLFAFSTVLGWSFYGTKACEFLFGTKATIVYKVIFVLFIVVGATMSLDLAWDIADTLNGLMAIPNLIGVLALSGTVVAITRNYIKRKLNHDDSIQPMLSIFPDIQAEQEAKLRMKNNYTIGGRKNPAAFYHYLRTFRDAFWFTHLPRVKSGIATGALPVAIDCSESVVMHIQLAAS